MDKLVSLPNWTWGLPQQKHQPRLVWNAKPCGTQKVRGLADDIKLSQRDGEE